MAQNIVFGVKIEGNASGVIGAVNQVVSAFSKLDSKLKAMSNRAVNASINSPAASQAGNNTKSLAAAEKQLELQQFQNRVKQAREEYRIKVRAAKKYYDGLKEQQKEINRLTENRAKAATEGKSTESLDKSISAKKTSYDKSYATFLKTYYLAVKQANDKITSAVAAANKKQLQIQKKSYAEQEGLAKKDADNKIREQRRLTSEIQRLGRSAGANLGRAFNQMTATATSAFNSFRLVTQGLTEIARTITMFVAIPIAGYFYQAFNAATSFQSAMVRVDKTTNGMKGKLPQLTAWIRDFALYTTSSQEELAVFAEQLGQVGVDEVEPMKMLIRTVEMMATATDLSADEVTKAIGRIGTAFGYDLNSVKGARDMHRLANAVNYLENTTAASAGEIVEGMLNVASTGGMLDIPIDKMAAIVAVMESMGVAADAVGNRITRFFQQVIGKPDELAQMLEGFKATSGNIYATADDIMRALERDPAVLLADIADALGQVNTEVEGNKAEALKQWFDIFGQVGGKVGVLAGNTAKLTEAMKNASNEFLYGNSLFEEYDKALMTTESHMKILRNNINNAAITMGDAFLPTINRLIEYAIPAIQILTSAFKDLKFEVKLLVVGVPILVAVLAPLLFIFAQLAHGAGMLFMGFHTVFLAFKSIGGAVVSLVTGLMGVFKAMRLLAAGGAALGTVFAGGLLPALGSILVTLGLVAAAVTGVALAFRAIGKELLKRGVDIAGFFKNLSTNMRTWGENVMISFGNGLVAGAVGYVAKVLSKIAEMIASFFESHSPPKEGPLSDIDKWGGPLFSTFLRGFYLADFSILEDIGGTIRSILENMITGDEADSAIGQMVANARVAIAELINVFNKTGEISQGLLDRIVTGTGSLGGEVKKLITLSLEYERIQRRIAALEKQKEQTNKAYEDEVARIAASNMTAEQKAQAIRDSLSKRNKTLSAIEKEKKAEEEKSDTLKEQLDWQKAFIKAQIDQANMFAKIAAAMERAAGAMEEIGKLSFGGGKKPEENTEGGEEDFTTTIQKRIDSAKRVIQEFIRGLKGQNPMPITVMKLLGLDDETIAEMSKAYDWGKKIYELFHPKGGGESSSEPSIFQPVLDFLNGLGGGAGAAFEGFVSTFSTFIQPLKDMLEASGVLDDIKDFIKWISGGETKEGEKNIISFADVMRWLGMALGFIAGLFLSLIGIVYLGPRIIAKKLEEWRQSLVDGVASLLTTMQNKAAEIINTIGDFISEQIEALIDTAQGWGETLIEVFGEGIGGAIKKYITDPVTKVAQAIADFFEPGSPPKEGPLSTIDTWGEKLIGMIADGITNAISKVGESASKIGAEIAKYLDVASGAVTGVLANVKNWGTNLISTFADGISAGAEAVASKVTDAAQRIADFLKPGSDPKEGPLSDITTWGSKLLTTFIEGFKGGDYNPIEKIAGKIGDAITNIFGGEGEDGAEKVNLVDTFIGMLSGIVDAFTDKIPAISDSWTQIKNLPTTVFGEDYGGVVVGPIFQRIWEVVEGWFSENTPLVLSMWEEMRDTFKLAFDRLYGMIALAFTAILYHPQVVDAIRITRSKFYEEGKAFAQAIGMGIADAVDSVISTFSTMVNGMITQVERGLVAVNSMIAALLVLNELSGNNIKLSTGEISSPPGLASGGVAVSPTLAMIAEGGEPEAVIPLSRLPALMNGMMPVPESTQIVIQINNPDFRDDKNMRAVIREVRKDLNATLRDQKRLRGRS